MGFNSFLSYRICFVIYVTTLRVHKWMCLRGSEWTPFVDAFFMQQRAETRQLNSKLTAFYYNVMYMTVRVIVINIIVVCPARDACRRDNHRITTMKSFYCNSTKLISDEINSSRPIYTIYKAVKMFLNDLYPTRKLQRFKSLPPRSSVSHGLWKVKLKTIGVFRLIHEC